MVSDRPEDAVGLSNEKPQTHVRQRRYRYLRSSPDGQDEEGDCDDGGDEGAVDTFVEHLEHRFLRRRFGKLHQLGESFEKHHGNGVDGEESFDLFEVVQLQEEEDFEEVVGQGQTHELIGRCVDVSLPIIEKKVRISSIRECLLEAETGSLREFLGLEGAGLSGVY